ncbi:uncharacterized protein ColSpa_09793 [Colletotrichum spaethianum]|uniref:Uncharacterized protein n=1 Tax=Colletotrichum spaethianum TaxID=700344 RepID=A0AA37PCD1_9PEZI|nr:uncharacterized protein ColSpa_09793 [Colletotrichum spaethianum]GKT49612.1 hypothetical protein ColSpa_09793 [Colletotrichum spaethianum]
MSILPGTEAPWTSLNILSNCSLTGEYVGWIVTQHNEPPFPRVARFWRTATENHDIEPPSNAEIIEWHEWARSNSTHLGNDVNRYRPCRPEMCQSIGSEIDGGLAGFGLLASYGFETIVLTVYCLFAVRRFFTRRKNAGILSEKPHTAASDSKPRLVTRISVASRCTTYDFFTAAAFLSLGIQATVIYSQVTPVAYRYNSSLQLIVSAMAFYPLAAMLPLVLTSVRRSWLKGAVLICLFVIHTAAWVLCTNNAQEDYYQNERVFDLCPENHPPQGVVSAAMFTMAAMVWMPPLFGICLSVVLCFYRCNNRKMWRANWLNKVANWAMVLYAAANFICTWGAWVILLGFFSSAPRRAEETWSLGQALALTPWIPVLVELVTILCLGTEAGFAGRLPLEFQVVRQEKLLHQQEGAAFLDDARVRSME